MIRNLMVSVACLAVGIAAVIAIAAGIGWVLHWLLPAVDFGMAVLIGLLAFYVVVSLTLHPFFHVGPPSRHEAPVLDDEPDESDDSYGRPPRPRPRSRSRRHLAS